jgi:hypothetical protein
MTQRKEDNLNSLIEAVSWFGKPNNRFLFELNYLSLTRKASEFMNQRKHFLKLD